ncbi:T9SS type A sorting domain-containing protein [Tamlana sp. I1]|uniref:T9SS type A sorting domain-containing protein n=1 Tax=Tamlana sp. I1 TaxID=2762061 RepID=UPI00188FED59|nr:T9SS type A sorting domain-containing protein [Tamlana sp. I1]
MTNKTTYQNFIKKTTLKPLFALCIFFAAHHVQAQTMIVDFENPANYTFGAWGGATSEAVANPDASGSNTSATVAKFTNGGGVWANGNAIDLTTELNYSDLASLQFSIKAPNTQWCLVQLKNGDDNVAEVGFNASSTTAWENIDVTLDFKGPAGTEATATYNKIVFFLNPNNESSGDEWYVDNIANSATLSSKDFNQDSFDVYPNPVSNVLKLRGNQSALDGVKISILSLTGQLIKTSHSATINVSDIKPGLYLVSVKNKLGQISTKKFIKA